LTFIAGFEKVIIWGGARYGKLRKLVVLKEKEGGMNYKEYFRDILNREMFDFWMERSEELRYIMMMEAIVKYHQQGASD